MTDNNMSDTPRAKSVFIIIPVFNRKDTTLECLERLSSFGYLQQPYQVVVVDDASTDGTAEAIRDRFCDVKVLTGDGDLWWTGGIVMGMKYAFEAGADYCVWLNDDCLPDAETLPTMVKFANENPRTIVGPSCFSLESGVWTIRNSASTGRQGYAGKAGETVYVNALSGWCVLIPRTVVAKIGLPDVRRFPHYDADIMYVLRATRAGFKACILGDAKVKVLDESGKEHPRRVFRNYFGRNLGPKETFSALFLSKKSPYRIPSQFPYHTVRHGYLIGVPLFAMKLATWLFKWVRLQILSQLGAGPFRTENSH